MTAFVFDPPEPRGIAVVGEAALYPVRRIFCVGRNYAAHAAEMGATVDREAPFYFTKSPSAVVASGASVSYPPGTENYHHEMELVVAMGAEVFRVDSEAAGRAIFGYGCGLDMTRRDLQLKAREKQRPWDTGKDFEESAVFAALTPREIAGELPEKRIWLSVNGSIRQDAKLSDLIHAVPEIVADLSQYYHLGPGDVIMTGTPAGVGPVVPGDQLEGGIDGLEPVSLTIGERA